MAEASTANDNFSQRLKQAYSFKRNLKLLFNRPSDHVAEIDGLRALSILCVLIAHLVLFLQVFYPPIPVFAAHLPLVMRYLENGGFLGVCVFFVISGYLISSILLTEYRDTGTIHLKHFYYRRFLRLMPVYWFCLALGALAGFPNFHYAWSNVLYINNFIPFDNQYLSWTWSLAVEEQFYFLFPLGLLAFFSLRPCYQSPLRVAAICYAVFISLSCYVIYHFNLSQPPMDLSSGLFKRFGDLVYVKPYTGFSAILSGIVVSYMENYRQNLPEIAKRVRHYKLDKLLLLVAIVLIISCFLIGDPGAGQGLVIPPMLLGCYATLFSISIAYLIFYMRSYQTAGVMRFKRLLKARVLYVIAQLSYSAYLFHLIVLLPVYYTIKKMIPSLHYTQLLLIGAPLVCVLLFLTCVLSYLLIERPFMNFRRK